MESTQLTLWNLKSEMLNKACPVMTCFYSELLFDFEEVEDMPIGSIRYWYVHEDSTFVSNPADKALNAKNKQECLKYAAIKRLDEKYYSISMLNK